jgi:hypothetical protein
MVQNTRYKVHCRVAVAGARLEIKHEPFAPSPLVEVETSIQGVHGMKLAIIFVLALNAALLAPAVAQQFVYPAKGQTPEQQKADEATCYQWAVQQSGFDPAKPPPAAPAPQTATTATGTVPGAGLRGAARGAVVGELISDDPGAGAAAGAVAARGQSRRQAAAAGQEAQQQQTAVVQQQQAAFDKARAACLEGEGYTVK